MPSNQSTIEKIKKQISDLNNDELRQVRNYTDNQLHEKDPDGSSKYNDVKNQLGDMSQDDLVQLRENINVSPYIKDCPKDTRVSSSDASADDEKRKYIAQHGSNPNAQQTAQSVPAPVDEKIKKLQDDASEIEHMAKGPAADGSH